MDIERGFMYYFPSVASLELGSLSDYGLSHLEGLNLKRGEVLGTGPDGGKGALRSFGKAQCGYFPDRQTWKQSGKIWIGYEEKPEPSDLLRRDVKGYKCQTLFGEFIISPVRFMPRVVKLNEQGELEYEPQPEYAEVAMMAYELSERIAQYHLLGKFPDELETEQVRLAVKALSVNYYIGLPECNAFGILDDKAVYDIDRAVIDIDAIISLMDKKKAEG